MNDPRLVSSNCNPDPEKGDICSPWLYLRSPVDCSESRVTNIIMVLRPESNQHHQEGHCKSIVGSEKSKAPSASQKTLFECKTGRRQCPRDKLICVSNQTWLTGFQIDILSRIPSWALSCWWRPTGYKSVSVNIPGYV